MRTPTRRPAHPRRAGILLALAVLGTGFACLPSHAENQFGAGRYTVTQWTVADGLPSNVIREIFEGRDGYLWVGTLSGLARFDGNEFETFNMTNTPALRSGRIVRLFEDTAGDLWIGTWDGGIYRRRDEVVQLVVPSEGAVAEFFEQPPGNVWVKVGGGLVRAAAGSIHWEQEEGNADPSPFFRDR
ncbi:MAG: hypothetical protein KC729_20970, partial [Candidatus Eisenbacteria bacterium]|nr:hypothetical protein [Candidatus Eisenbacteria bacterium]